MIAGHWIAIVPQLRDGIAGGELVYNLVPALWPATWVFQVVPLFFFVGGFANRISFASAGGVHPTRSFLARRLRRLLVPTAAFLAFWAAVELLMNAFDIGGGSGLRGMRLGHMTPFAPLWFLGVYLVLIALSPVSIRLHERFRWWVPAGLLLGITSVDGLAIATHTPAIEFVNLVLVWALPHQLGHLYADGMLQRIPPARLAWIVIAALVALAALTTTPFYGRNLLDTGNALLGTSAPTLPFAIAGIGYVAAALLLRNRALAWLENGRRWRALSRVNSVVMTLFLWHMSAYFAALMVLAGLGVPLPATPDSTWWLERPIFLVAPAVILVPLVWLFARIERRRLRVQAA